MAISLGAVGLLSNIAVAMRMQPAILPKIREIVLMGGAYGTGNFTPSAEFNIFADPEAARVVFHLRRSISDDGPRSYQPDRLHRT